MSRVTDYYGPIPYTKEGTAGATTPYDSQQTVYNAFFAQLDTAVTNLTTYTKANPGLKPFAKFDMVYGGDYTEWIKYANSLRLRLAMHIVNADPATAKTQALKAINDPGGLILTNADNAAVNGILSYHNPIWWIGTSWTDLCVGASLTSYLNGYNDPRASKMISPASAPAAIAGQYVGIRAGTPVGGKPMYNGYSQPNYDVISEYSPMILINACRSLVPEIGSCLKGLDS